MSISIYDSSLHKDVEFSPLQPGKVSIYVCGATVQGSPHIGHVRSAVAFDVITRWLIRSGYEVTLVRNVTDIDDKILTKSAEAGWEWWAWAYRFEREFAQAYDALGLLPPTYEPRATGHMPEMIALVETLMARGHAYQGEGSNVYFDVSSFAQYGDLTNQGEGVVFDEDEGGASDKRDPRDFALWKSSKPHEPATAAWDSPWGPGRPAWHLECSAMSGKYLGDAFDIHGGGIDLRFPHHENEIAQSRAAGKPFAKYWMHNAWVTIRGEKMSKSLGNSLVVSELIKQVPAPVIRFWLGTIHYRSTVEYAPELLAEAEANWERIAGFVDRSVQEVGVVEDINLSLDQLPIAFVEAMNDDLNLAGAMASVYEQLRRGNIALGENDDEQVYKSQQLIRSMLDVLGIDPISPVWNTDQNIQNDSTERALEALVEAIIEKRAKARKEKNWQEADALRDQILMAGITVEDSQDGARWHVG